MNYSIYFLPEVEDDIFEGYQWYEKNISGLGNDFLHIFYASAIMIQNNPLLFQKVYGSFRRMLMNKFPYSIYYRIYNNKIIVFGVFHTARSNDFISTKLKKRN